MQDESEDAGYLFMEKYIARLDGLYLLSCCITIVIIVIPVCMFLWYKISLKKSHYIEKEESLGNDKSFEDWIGCEEGNRRFLHE